MLHYMLLPFRPLIRRIRSTDIMHHSCTNPGTIKEMRYYLDWRNILFPILGKGEVPRNKIIYLLWSQAIPGRNTVAIGYTIVVKIL